MENNVAPLQDWKNAASASCRVAGPTPHHEIRPKVCYYPEEIRYFSLVGVDFVQHSAVSRRIAAFVANHSTAFSSTGNSLYKGISMKFFRGSRFSAISTLSFSLVVFLVLSPTLFAQEDVLRPRIIPGNFLKPITLGLEVGGNFNMFSQTIEQDPVVPDTWLEAHKTGTGISPYVGLMVDVPLGKLVSLQVKGTYDSKSFGNTERIKYDSPLLLGGIKSMDVDWEYSVQVNYIGAGLAARVNVTPELFATVGTIAHFRVTDASIEGTQTIVAPEEGVWTIPGKPNSKVNSNSSTDTSYTSTRIGLEVGAGYKIPIAKQFFLVPQLRYQYMFDKLFANALTPRPDASRATTERVFNYTTKDAALHSIQLGVALWFQL
jgi:hypothetical protein